MNSRLRKKQDKKTQEDIRKLVIERIKALSDDLRVSVGLDSKGYTKDELIESVKRKDQLGREIIETQMEFLRDMAAGKIYRDE